MPRRLAIGQEVKIENPNHRSALTLLLAAKAAQAQAVAQPQAQAQPQVQIQVSTAAKTSLSDIKIVCQNIQEKVGRIHKLQEDAIVAIDQEAINEKLQCGMKELEVLSKETQYALQLAIKTNVGAQTAFAAAIKAESECQKAQKEFAWATEQRNAAPIRNNWQFMCEHNVSQAKQWLKIATKNKKRAVQTARDATADALKIANLTHASAKSIVNLLEMTHPDEISDLQIANILSLQQDVSNRALDLIFNLGEQYKELRSIN
jgi:hypothetical protein